MIIKRHNLTDFPLWYRDLLKSISLTSELSRRVRKDLCAAVSGIRSAEYATRAFNTRERTVTTRAAQRNLALAYDNTTHSLDELEI